MALGRQEGLQKGLEKGLQKGEALALQRLLTRRFGSLPPAIEARIAAASIEEIDAWVDAFIDAPSLEAIFASQR